MHFRSPRAIATFLATAALLTAGGCTTPPAAAPTSVTSSAPGTPTATAETPQTPPPPEGIPLVAGMNSSEVEKLLGKPLEIRPMEVNGVQAHVWIYHREGPSTRREITTGVRELHYVDPVSGRELTRQEPIMGYVIETPQLELRLLIFNGSLVNWSQVVRSVDQIST